MFEREVLMLGISCVDVGPLSAIISRARCGRHVEPVVPVLIGVDTIAVVKPSLFI